MFQPVKQRDSQLEGEEGVCLKKTWKRAPPISIPESVFLRIVFMKNLFKEDLEGGSSIQESVFFYFEKNLVLGEFLFLEELVLI